jgi:hypothetical protein
MSNEKILCAAIDAFRQTFLAFCEEHATDVEQALCPKGLSLMTQGLMSAAQKAGQQGLAVFLSQHDIEASSVTERGVKYRYKNTVDKTYLTMFGDVVVSRAVYGNDLLGGYVVPLDRALGLSKDDSATLDAREMILFAASTNTPEEVAVLLSKASMCRPCRSTVQEIICRDGTRIEEHRIEIAQRIRQTQSVPDQAHTLVTSMDGANVRLREAGVKKGRKAQRPRDSQSNDELSNSSFRNAMVGCVSWYGQDQDAKAQRLSTTYQARMPQDHALVFKEEFEAAIKDSIEKANAAHRNIGKVLLCDGHRAIWNYAKHTELFADFQWCVDFYHATEHLSKAAEAIFGAKSTRGHWWFDKWREALKTSPGAPTAIIRSIEGYITRNKLTKSRLKEATTELTFFKRNHHLMRYQEFLIKGLPIGSGPVEAAAKTIVKQRMCRSGMRWNRETGQHVLSLRAYVKSQTWDAMWNAYVTTRMAA